ncbi:MAG: aminopeptidase [Ruminococcus sp.]|nr:aminopeptidase [Ruminococcus sp.]
MKKTVLREYAKLLAIKGVNVQKDQEVVIVAELDQPEFVKMLVEECYRAGAGKVTVEWSYQPLRKLSVRYQKEKVLSRVEDWEIEKMKHRAKTLPAMIYLESEDPDGLKGINQKKMAKCLGIRRGVFKPYRDEMDNKYQWCIAAVAGKDWAKKVFPGERSSVAVEKLWEAILYTSRAQGDGIKNWEEHNEDLKNRYEYLNSLSITELHYTSSNGTDLTVGLLPQGRFLGGSETLLNSDVEFNANIPSEEVFTSPDRNRADGVVYASMPLSYQGALIENFWFRFENGKIVEAHAEKGEELLNSILDTDEGARYLGECALVPYDSPIRNSGILFYNTLFDENAACHLAFGEGFSACVKDYEKYTLEEIRELGINNSIVHVDFMIGTKDLCITAKTSDGTQVQIFKDGNWAF